MEKANEKQRQVSNYNTMTIPIIVSAGGSLATLKPISVNADLTPLEFVGEHFIGRATVRLRPHYQQARTDPESGYFDKREGEATWSIAIEGRFLEEHSADDVSLPPSLSTLAPYSPHWNDDRSCLEILGRTPLEIDYLTVQRSGLILSDY